MSILFEAKIKYYINIYECMNIYITFTLGPPFWPLFFAYELYFFSHSICLDADENFGECYWWILFDMKIIASLICVFIGCHLELPSFGQNQAVEWSKWKEIYGIGLELENEVKRLILKFCIYEMKWINSVNYFRNVCILLLNQPIFTK